MAVPARTNVDRDRPPPTAGGPLVDAADSERMTGATAEFAVADLPPPPSPTPPEFTALARELFQPAAPVAPAVVPAVPGYEILRLLGRGGMGVVYLAKQRGLNRLVALKMLRAEQKADQVYQARMRTEAEAIARLQHPNIVQVFEVGEHEGRPFCALEYVPGGTLAEACHDKLPAPQAAAALIATLAEAVHYAHEHGVLHRDLKPANILLAETASEGDERPRARNLHFTGAFWPTPKIADFGLAKWLDRDIAMADGISEHGLVIGTPSYMAPEQVGGSSSNIGVTTDVYALGAILYELLAGRPPFKADTPLETARQTQFDDPAPLRRLQPRIPHDLETICLRCLQKSPERRYPSAQALADELHRFCAGEPIHARPIGIVERSWKWARRRPAAAALIAVAIVACGAVAAAGWVFAAREREHARVLTSERDAAEKARQEKDRFLRQALETSERIRHLTDGVLESIDPARLSKVLLAEMAEVYRQEIERDRDNLDWTVRRVRAKNMARLADTLRHLGEAPAAIDYQRQTVALERQLVAAAPTDMELRLELGMALNRLGLYLRRLDTTADVTSPEAIAAHREAVEVLAPVPADIDRLPRHSARGAALNNVAVALLGTKDPRHLPEICTLYEQAVQQQERAHQVRATNLTRQYLCNHHAGWADALIRMGDHASAAEHARRLPQLITNDVRIKRDAATILRSCARLAGADPNLSAEQRRQLADAYTAEAQQVTAGSEPRGRN